MLTLSQREADIRRHIQELRNVQRILRPDADDPLVLSELTAVDAELAAAQRELTTTFATNQPNLPVAGVPPIGDAAGTGAHVRGVVAAGPSEAWAPTN